MPLYRYVKKENRKRFSSRKKGFNGKIISIQLVILGLFLLGNAAYPIVSYQLLVSPRFSNSFISPSTEASVSQGFGISVNEKNNEIISPISDKVLGSELDFVDFTKASNWYPDEKTELPQEGEIETYYLSIPKLNIFDAKVIAGDDLKKSLIQYFGTALPGKYGNTVVFGHSVLPQFFNPKNYTTIFSTLPTLKQKDEIIVKYNEVEYRYLVENMLEVSPTDISILAQRYDDSYLTLITCVPPGTYLRRLIVRSRLSRI